MLIDSDILRN